MPTRVCTNRSVRARAGDKIYYSAIVLDDEIAERIKKGLIKHVSAGLSSRDYTPLDYGWIKLQDAYTRELRARARTFQNEKMMRV